MRRGVFVCFADKTPVVRMEIEIISSDTEISITQETRTYYIINIFYSQGIMRYEFIPHDQTLTKEMYIDLSYNRRNQKETSCRMGNNTGFVCMTMSQHIDPP